MTSSMVLPGLVENFIGCDTLSPWEAVNETSSVAADELEATLGDGRSGIPLRNEVLLAHSEKQSLERCRGVWEG
eukprot:CAMPEP_0184687130 /NCGR_PEP_ID=MMETSP0312-20130426/25234_1 /TAXON_ID=31354 /ORGANISM="Compsopogon coeruleus, Strain SAG 36.94" /LENGTH=73 /DNA_ID=CAMNT_0027142917 /DNA_START=792 /DNA_END=1014 /DNA_ORIENTATION=+